MSINGEVWWFHSVYFAMIPADVHTICPFTCHYCDYLCLWCWTWPEFADRMAKFGASPFWAIDSGHIGFFGSPEKEPNASDRGVPRLKDQSKNLQDQSLGWTSRGPKMLPMDAEGFITLRLGLALQSTTNGFCRSLWSGFHQHQIVAIPDIPDIPCFLRCSVLFLWQSNRAQDMMIPNDHCVVFFQHGEQLNGPKKLEAGWRCHWVNLGALVV